MESYHHRPLWDRSFKSPKKKSKKKLPLHVGSWKVEKTFKLFLLKLPRWIFQNVSQDLKFSPKVGRVWNTSKSCTWEANLVKIYQSIFNRYIYIYTPEAFKIALNHLDFKIPHLSLLLKILEMVGLSFMRRQTRQWGFVMTAAEWPSWLHLLR